MLNTWTEKVSPPMKWSGWLSISATELGTYTTSQWTSLSPFFKKEHVKEDLCPENVIDILNLLGYEDYDYDTNGWEQDTWISFSKENEDTLILYCCGRTFEMNLSICPEED